MPLEIHPGFSTIMLAVQAGIKLPTGKAEERMPDGQLVDPHLQIGTGSTDFLIGTNFLYGKNRFAITGNFLYSIKTKGKTGYRFGNDMNYDIEARYKVFESGVGRNMIMLNGGFYGEYKAQELQDNVILDNSGGNTVYISAGLDYFITPYFLLDLQFQKPVYYHLYGIQDGETFRVKSGIQFLLY